jgi:hypothetical protein
MAGGISRPRNLALGKSIARSRICARSSAHEVGGARRDRTDDLLLAKQALSQLSYGPRRARRVLARRKSEARSQKPEVDVRSLASDFWLLIAGVSHLIVVGLGRLELPTSRLSGVRSNHLSYRPDLPRSRSCLKKEKRRRRNPALF